LDTFFSRLDAESAEILSSSAFLEVKNAQITLSKPSDPEEEVKLT
jgi:hypothetical protein